MRLPRLAPCCIRCSSPRCSIARTTSCASSGTGSTSLSHQNCTVSPESYKFSSTASVSVKCASKAPATPSAGISRVFTRPASGHLANCINTAPEESVFVISNIRTVGVSKGFQGLPAPVSPAQTPHKKNRFPDAALLPAPAICCDLALYTERAGNKPKPARHLNIFHDGHGLESSEDFKHAPTHKQSLITRANAC